MTDIFEHLANTDSASKDKNNTPQTPLPISENTPNSTFTTTDSKNSTTERRLRKPPNHNEKENTKKSAVNYYWNDREFIFSVNIPENTCFTLKNITSFEYFQMFFSKDLIYFIVENIQLYFVQ